MLNKRELIIDANILMSALVATSGKTYDLIFSERIKLFSPEFLLEEFENHKKEILEKSKLSDADFKLFLSLISAEIEFVSRTEFEKYIPNASEFTPDSDDTEYFALAMKLKCALWSNDKALKNQDKIKVYNTKELLEIT